MRNVPTLLVVLLAKFCCLPHYSPNKVVTQLFSLVARGNIQMQGLIFFHPHDYLIWVTMNMTWLLNLQICIQAGQFAAS